RSASRADLSAAEPVLTEVDGVNRYEGEVDGGVVWWAAARADGWDLDVDGAAVRRVDAFGWANAYQVDGSGSATPPYDTPIERRVLAGAQAAAWVVAAYVLWRTRHRDRLNTDAGTEA